MPLAPLSIVGLREDVYYVPQVLATELGYFQSEGLRVDYREVKDTEGQASAVASGYADFALGGLWRPLLYTQIGKPYVAFAEFNSQVPAFVFARSDSDRPNRERLAGRTILLTSVDAPSPWFAVQELLMRRKAELGSLQLVPGLPVAEARRLFESGVGDLIELFDMEAASFLRTPGVHLISDWRTAVGSVPWSVYYTTPAILQQKRSEAIALTRSIRRALEWIRSHEAREIVDLFMRHSGQGMDEALGQVLVETYIDQGLWDGGPAIAREGYLRWGEILIRARWLSELPPYHRMVDPEIVAEASRD